MSLCFFQALESNRRLCAELTPHALDLIEAFGLPEELLAAPIASGNFIIAVVFCTSLNGNTVVSIEFSPLSTVEVDH